MERTRDQESSSHVLLLPYPSQGHYNPLLQFGKRLAATGLRTTLLATRYVLKTAKHETGPVKVEPISDGFDHGGFGTAGSIEAYLSRLESEGSASLEEVILAQRVLNRPVRVLVYDAFLPWAVEVGQRFGLTCAVFFTQSAAVNAIYCHVWQGRLKFPVHEPVESLAGLPRLEPADLPSFLADPIPGPYPAYLALVLNQYRNLDQPDAVLINSFYELEREEMNWMKSIWNAMTIGPTLPSKYLDNRLPEDYKYGFDLFDASDEQICMNWLDSKPPKSVVYVSFGSMAAVNETYMEEIAEGLRNARKFFVWVVRSSETEKLPKNFLKEIENQGIVISWSPQLEVLAHGAVGCFVTHCGWNSTMEAVSLAVPMVAVPQWTDQPTSAKYVEDVWKVGVRVRVDEGGVLRRDELERCIREVMEGNRGGEISENSKKWSDLAKQAVSEGGSSDLSINEFISKYCS